VSTDKQKTFSMVTGDCISGRAEKNGFMRVARMEAGSNTSTVTLRVVGGDEKGSLKSETVKYGREYQGTRIRERVRWQGPATYTKDRSVLSSERAPHKKIKSQCDFDFVLERIHSSFITRSS
jgi:hypothetical protein